MNVEAIKAIWDRRKLLALAVLAAALTAGLTLALATPGIYRSTATVLVARPEIVTAANQAALSGELEARLNRIGERIVSRSRLEALIAQYGLYESPASDETEKVERFRRDIRVDLKGIDPVQGRGRTIAFAVSYRGRDPETVALVANELAAAYIAENSATREQRATETVQDRKREVDDAQRRLDEQDRRINEFKRRNMGQLPEQVSANLSMLERLNAQLSLNNHNQIRVLERRALLARRVDADGVIAANPEEALQISLAQMNVNLARLQRQYSDKYPDVIALKADIESTKRQLAALGPSRAQSRSAAAPGTAPGAALPTDADLNALKAEETRLRQMIAAYQSRVEIAPEREQQLQQLSRDHRATREMYEAALRRYHEAQAAVEVEQLRASQEFQILEQAVPARVPNAPNRAKLILGSIVLALATTGLAVMLAEQLDTSFHGLNDVRAFTKLPVLASIPQITTRADVQRRMWRLRLAAGLGVLGLIIIGGLAYIGARNDLLVALLTRSAS